LTKGNANMTRYLPSPPAVRETLVEKFGEVFSHQTHRGRHRLIVCRRPRQWAGAWVSLATPCVVRCRPEAARPVFAAAAVGNIITINRG
jgi:hypothetical protein